MVALENQFKDILGRFPTIELAVLFGSCASGRQTSESDLDVAVAGDRPFSLQERLELTDILANRFQRPVDLVDLRHASPTLLREALVKGTVVLCSNNDLLEKFILRLWHNEADLMPCYRQAQYDRLVAFANGSHSSRASIS